MSNKLTEFEKILYDLCDRAENLIAGYGDRANKESEEWQRAADDWCSEWQELLDCAYKPYSHQEGFTCPKCGCEHVAETIHVIYDSDTDLLNVICDTCGYREPRLPLDAPKQ